MKRFIYFVVALAASVMMASCEKPLEELNPEFPALGNKSVEIKSGETVKLNFNLNDVRGNKITTETKSTASEEYAVAVKLDADGSTGSVSITAPSPIHYDKAFDVTVTFSDEQNGRKSVSTINVQPVLALEGLNPSFPSLTAEQVEIKSGEVLAVDFKLSDVRGFRVAADVTSTASDDYSVAAELGADGESGTVTITAPALILDDAAFDVNLVFTEEEHNRTANAKFTVKPVLVEGLVKLAGHANSFIVPSGAVALFPTFKGNSSEKVAVASIKLEWQDAAGLYVDCPQISDGEAIVRFAEGKEGNAVLSGVNAAGVVAWSWHFWVVNDTPKDVAVGGYTFMDRNVGALNLDEKSELSVGVTYQYGRKDPFPGIKFTEYKEREIYGADGQPISVPIVKTTEADNLETTIQNPGTFYNNVYVSGAKHGYSWITTDATTYGADKFAALWENGGKKTMYDPCPAGYVVAPVAAWDAVKAATADKVTELWDSAYETFDASAIGTNDKYAAGNRKKVQFRGCLYGDLRLTVTGEISSNSASFSYANCVGKALPTAVVWCADIDASFKTNPSASYFRGCAVKVNTSGNGNYDDVSAVKVNALATTGKYTLMYRLPVRCIREQ
ncbi:MAG: hypothetical protein MJY83_05320 [Bacteroidales bacterium]|nr:hypothetical protein [Bacteroidales bacterium]